MNILIVSERFEPSVGGVETVTRLLAEALVQAGNKVKVVTNTGASATDTRRVQVLRCPAAFKLIKQYQAADVVILQGPTVRLGWPLLFGRHRVVMVHHMRNGAVGNVGARWMRRRLVRRFRQAAVSRDLATALGLPEHAVLPNPYDAAIFRIDRTRRPDRDVICVARLIREKGVHVLVKALALLGETQPGLTTTIVGDGPERARLQALVCAERLESSVRFAGEVTNVGLARLFQGHRILVVPSTQREAFGLVALEGIACGCIVMGSDLGGLPEAIGPCGLTFKPGDSTTLASRLRDVLSCESRLDRFREQAEQHLRGHRPETVAQRYLEFIQQ